MRLFQDVSLLRNANKEIAKPSNPPIANTDPVGTPKMLTAVKIPIVAMTTVAFPLAAPAIVVMRN